MTTPQTTLPAFESLGLSPLLLTALARINYTTATAIQAQAIPAAIAGKDILGSAKTGSGKTAAFMIPMIQYLLTNPQAMGLVLLPTRELAAQVADVAKQLCASDARMKTALLIGGEPMPKQFQQLRARPRIIIGTPGRVNDHLQRGTLALHQARFMVLDETDRMLDMGFGIQIKEIMKYVPAERQTLMFSATMPAEIVSLTKQYLKNPERISIDSVTSIPKNVTQSSLEVQKNDKYTILLKELEKRDGSVIVFVKTKIGAEKLADKLRRLRYSSDYIHGDLKQSRRDKVIRAFRDNKYRVMIATDVAARGLDIPHVQHVINYDLPQCPEDYIHRIGRTGRAGASGASLTLITPEDYKQWKLIQRVLNPDSSGKAANSNHRPEQGQGEGQKRRRPFKGRFGKPFGQKRRPSFKGGNNEQGQGRRASGGHA